MGEASIVASNWRFVELGRVLLIQGDSPYAGRLATVVEIIDHKRVLADGPSSDPKLATPRHSLRLKDALMTPIVIPNLPRAARSGTVKTIWEKNGIDAKWKEGNWAKRKLQSEKRRALTDFDRFKVLRLKKQRRFEERKALVKVKASA